METNRIRQFLAVIQTGSIRAASELLHITPGGLSKSLDILEEELGLGPLFRKDGRSLAITDIGRQVEIRTSELLRAEELLKKPTKNTEDISLRISTFEVFSTYFMSHFVATASKGLKVTCSERTPGLIEQDVLSRKSNIGLTYEPVPLKGIEFLKVCKITMGIFGKKSLTNSLPFKDWVFAAPRIPIDQTPTGVKGLDGWPDNTFPRKILYEVEMLETALGLARSGLALVHIPSFVAKLHNDVTDARHKLDEIDSPIKPINRWVYLIQRTGQLEDKVIKQLVRALRQVCINN